MARPRPFVLTILDGWGHSPEVDGNAIAQARKPNFDRLWSAFPHALIEASGTSVGLPEGQIGNSEAGHLNIGAGRVVQMDVTRVDQMIADGEFFRNAVLIETMQYARNHPLHGAGRGGQGDGRRAGSPGLVREGDYRRVHRTDRSRRRTVRTSRSDPRQRRSDLLQFSARPGATDDASLLRSHAGGAAAGIGSKGAQVHRNDVLRRRSRRWISASGACGEHSNRSGRRG